jgi:hypothetical protein
VRRSPENLASRSRERFHRDACSDVVVVRVGVSIGFPNNHGCFRFLSNNRVQFLEVVRLLSALHVPVDGCCKAAVVRH